MFILPLEVKLIILYSVYIIKKGNDCLFTVMVCSNNQNAQLSMWFNYYKHG